MSLQTFAVSAGHRISDEAAARILANGLPLDTTGVVVRVKNVVHSITNSTFIVQAVDETDVQTWKQYIHTELPDVEIHTDPVAENPDPPPSPLNISCKVGTWTKSIGNATTSVTGHAAQPKAVFIWTTGLSGATHGTFQEGGGNVFGFTDGTTQRCYGTAIEDNNTTANANMSIRNNISYTLIPTGTASGHVGETGTIALTSTGFDITWSATTVATVGHYMSIWGSDISNVKVMDMSTGTTSVGIKSYTGVGFKPDFGMIIHPAGSDAGSLPLNDTDPNPNWSVIAGNSTVRNWSTGTRDRDGTGTANSYRLQRTAKIFAGIMWDSTKAKQLAEFVQWTADGLDVNYTDAPDFNDDPMIAIFIKGGKWDAGYLSQPDTGGTSPTGDVVNLLADPFAVIKGLMCMSVSNIAQTTTTGNTNSRMSIGATDGTNQGCTTYGSNHAADPTITASKSYNNKLMAHNTPTATATSSTEEGLATIQDMATAGQFTVNYSTNTDAVNRQVVWFTISA